MSFPNTFSRSQRYHRQWSQRLSINRWNIHSTPPRPWVPFLPHGRRSTLATSRTVPAIPKPPSGAPHNSATLSLYPPGAPIQCHHGLAAPETDYLADTLRTKPRIMRLVTPTLQSAHRFRATIPQPDCPSRGRHRFPWDPIPVSRV